MHKMTPTMKSSCEAALSAYAEDAGQGGQGYQLMRYARMGFLEPNPSVLSESQVAEETALLAKLLWLPTTGPLPDFYTFLRGAKAGHYRLISQGE